MFNLLVHIGILDRISEGCVIDNNCGSHRTNAPKEKETGDDIIARPLDSVWLFRRVYIEAFVLGILALKHGA